MLIELIFFPPNKESSVTIFNSNFVNKNKNRYKIIYKNKTYPLNIEFKFTSKNKIKEKIQLKCYSDFLDISNLIKGTCFLYELFINQKSKKNYDKYLKFLSQDKSKMIYIIKQDQEKIKILGKNFVNNNKDKCIIIYKTKIFPLKEYFSTSDIEKGDIKLELFLLDLENITNRSYMFYECDQLEYFSLFENEKMNSQKELKENDKKIFDKDSKKFAELYNNYKNNKIDIEAITLKNKESSNKNSLLKVYKSLHIMINKIITKNNFTNLSYMFYNCSYLISLPDISQWNISQVFNLSYLFYGCSSLISLPGLSIWNTENLINMSYSFYGCSSLKSLPDISKWKTNKVSNLSNLFNNCSSLESLPDISKWNTDNFVDMSFIFKGCSSLISLPDISKWNINNVIDISGAFGECSLLISLPKLSKWNINKVTNLMSLFSNCSSLKSLPDISTWETNNVNDMSYIFSECNLLISLPDTSKWNTNKVTNLSNMFSNCSSLESLPDLSEWNTNKVIDMSFIFNECSSLISLPDISKWNTNKVNYMGFIFKGCSSLLSLPDISKWNTNNIGKFD